MLQPLVCDPLARWDKPKEEPKQSRRAPNKVQDYKHLVRPGQLEQLEWTWAVRPANAASRVAAGASRRCAHLLTPTRRSLIRVKSESLQGCDWITLHRAETQARSNTWSLLDKLSFLVHLQKVYFSSLHILHYVAPKPLRAGESCLVSNAVSLSQLDFILLELRSIFFVLCELL